MMHSQRLPPMLEGARRTAFALLFLLAGAEIVAQIAATAALKATLLGYTSGGMAAAWLLGTGMIAALLAWQRSVQSEAFGHAYVNALRRALGHHAVAVTAGNGSGRFGTLAIRLSSDLQAMKNWANVGVCGGLTGLLGVFGGLASSYLASGWSGLLAGIVVSTLAMVIMAGAYPALVLRVQRLRRERGRVSARVGDLLLGGPADASFAAEARALRPLDKAGSTLRSAAIEQERFVSLIRLPSLLAVPTGFALVLLMLPPAISSRAGEHSWATLLLALGILALGLSHLGHAVAAHAEWQAAEIRLARLVAQAGGVAPVTPSGRVRLPPGAGLSLRLDGRLLVDAGSQAILPRASIADDLPAIVYGAQNVMVGGEPATAFYPVDWPRRVAYVGSLRPLRRGTLTRVLAAKRNARPDAMRSALTIAGLDPNLVDNNPKIDPAHYRSDPDYLARLRLARALAHRPRILIIDDPWISASSNLMDRLRDWCTHKNVSLVVLHAA